MNPIEIVLAKLPGAKRAGNGWSARCPVHDDRTPSLSLSEGDDGRALVKCHAGCSLESIVAAIELRVVDLMPELPSRMNPKQILTSKPKTSGKTFPTASEAVADLERQHGKRTVLWTYHDEHGEPVGVVVRWDKSDGKVIRPIACYGNGWRIGAMPGPRPLFGLPDLATAPRIIVAEGEKAADTARAIGFSSTTSAGGAQAASKTDWRPLAGKEVWILPDNDAPGRKYAETVTAILAKLVPPSVVRVVELPDLPEGGDLVDWIDNHGDAAEPEAMRKEVVALAQACEPEGAAANNEEQKPFPVDALPEPLRGFVTAGAMAIGCDLSYLALPLITVLAAAIGTTRRLELKRGWSAPAIIWGAIVGESGTAKTPAFKLVMRPIRERQRKALDRHAEAMKQYEAEYARWEKDYAAWKRSKNSSEEPPLKPSLPSCERFIVSDTTVEALAPILLTNPRGLLLARDELAGWIGSFDRYAGKGKAGADSANWLSMFNAESIIVDRKTGIPRTIHVPQAAVCVSGGIQPGILHRALGSEHRESGLAARMLLTCPPRKAKSWTEADIDPQAEAELVLLVDRLFDLQPEITDEDETRPILVRLDPEAKAAWTTYYDAHAKEQSDLTGDLSAAWSKLEEYAARLALVVHFARWAVGDVSDELRMDAASMNSGIALAGWFKGEARCVYAMLGETDVERDQRRLVEWIGRKGGAVTVRAVQQGCRWLKEPGAAEAALDELVKTMRGYWRDYPTTPRGGRPARELVLKSSDTVYESPVNHAANAGSVDVDAVDGA